MDRNDAISSGAGRFSLTRAGRLASALSRNWFQECSAPRRVLALRPSWCNALERDCTGEARVPQPGSSTSSARPSCPPFRRRYEDIWLSANGQPKRTRFTVETRIQKAAARVRTNSWPRRPLLSAMRGTQLSGGRTRTLPRTDVNGTVVPY